MSFISSNIGSSAANADNVQDLTAFQYKVVAGDPTALVAVPNIESNAFQYINCSPCPQRVTLSLPAIAANGKPDPAGTPREIYKVLKPNESFNVGFKKDVILQATIEEVEAPVPGITTDDAAVPVTAASVDLEGSGSFLNC